MPMDVCSSSAGVVLGMSVGFMNNLSNGCSGSSFFSRTSKSMMTRLVSVAAQKCAGLSAHPICRAGGMTTRGLAPGGSGIT